MCCSELTIHLRNTKEYLLPGLQEEEHFEDIALVGKIMLKDALK
jgi:hypothetical protein